jgi:hypothetical protein
LALLYILIGFPVRGDEPSVGALPEGDNSRCGVSGVALNAPKPDENLSGMQGNRDEAMTTKQL